MTDKTHHLESSIINIVHKKLTIPLINDEVNIHLFGGFEWNVSPQLASDYRAWREKIESDEKPEGAIGGRFTFEITPTSIGLLVFVRDDITKEKFDLNEYGWF